MQYVIKQNQSVYDVSLLLYGDATYAVRLVEDNPDLESLDNEDIHGIAVTYDESVKPTIKTPLIVSNSVISDKIPNYIIKQHQSIYDLAITYGYGVEDVVNFLKDSPVLEDLDNTNISNMVILVTKRKSLISDALFLQNKVLATGVIGGGSFDDSFDDSFEN